MPTDDRAGFRTHWESCGAGGRPALLVHGMLAHSGVWRQVATDLLLSAVAFDLPGHGRSAAWSGGDYHRACTDIALSFCDAPMDIIGHSFGGTVALRLSVEHPELCRSLTLIEPVFFAAARADNAAEIAAHDASFVPVIDALAAGRSEVAARLFTGAWGDGRPWEALPEAQRAAMTARMSLVTAGAAAHDRDGAGLLVPGRMERLTMPVTLIRGERSPPVIAAVHRALIARLPQAEERVVAGAGHMLPLTHPGETARAIVTEGR
ncbi:alpha/beta fold hydrolase [Oceaniglobus trochenteri]|uniref:alpha/beta fold hydrolase n=1 Tax=Oceaniglobus trochenteri TaxID=2763260 RepID=UPI001CFFC9D1|nr:alpha/beta hydrolase [Oceaniglobus trochenteri]